MGHKSGRSHVRRHPIPIAGYVTKQERKLHKKKHRSAPKTVTQSTMKRNSPHCPKCQRPMRRRYSQYGMFWGCSSFPQCRGTRKVKP